MDCEQTIAYIESLSPTLEHPSLTRISKFLAELGNPQDQLKTLHVGGTNGKGSTVAILDSILRASAMKTGRFTGPHLLRWHERFHMNGEAIRDQDLARIGTFVRDKSEDFGKRHEELGPLTWFEFLTVLAFLYFLENNVDVAVMEVGLGGRFDATNVLCKPLCTGITNISLDHTLILGDTVEQIAFEKAGIIKAHVPIVTGAQGGALDVIAARANELNAPLTIVSDTACGEDLSLLANLSLPGVHQLQNACLAIQMLVQSGLHTRQSNRQPAATQKIAWTVSEKAIEQGLQQVYWPGRLQIVKELGLILDGAHNLAGIAALRRSLDKLYPGQNFQFVFGCYGNKNGVAMLQLLARPGDSAVITEPQSKRLAFDKEALAQTAAELGITYRLAASAGECMADILKEPQSSRLTVVTGSFAMLREVAIAIGWHRVEDGSLEHKVAID